MDYYKVNVEEIYKELNTKEEGLREEEALKRLKSFGSNELVAKRKWEILKIILNQFKDFLVWLLIFSALISFIINKDEFIDSILIIAVVLINAILGIAEELHARNTLKKISALESPDAIVKRDGILKKIKASDIVIGDIVKLEAGFLVPADIRIIRSYNLKALEAPLTGEETAVAKNNLAINEDKEIHDQTNMLFKGTFISEGEGLGVVVKTGNNSEIGQILKHVVETKSEKTPLEQSLDKVSRLIGVIIIGICLVVYCLELFITRDILGSFSLAISLSVAAIPEGLQSVLTSVMAISVLKMSKNKAVVKRMPVGEALGAINVIACDKTGTLTTGQLELSRLYALNNDTNSLAKTLNLASSSSTNKINQLLYKGHEEPVWEMAFNPKNKYEILIYKKDYKYKAYIKGAFDVLYSLAKNKDEALYKKALELTKNKERVLFVGHKEGNLEDLKSPKGLILEGLVSFKDEVREGVCEAIREAKGLGVKPIMITGDFKETAFKIASEVGIASDIKEVISHDELQKMDNKMLKVKINNYSVYARVLPLDKLRIIDAYLKNENVIAYVGDGINDAPALKKASVGICVSKGLDLAKDASDMILLDDSFKTISDAIKEGRRNFHNIRKAIRYLLSSNIGEVTVVLLAAILSVKYESIGVCLSPIELLWINLVTDTLPAVALGIDNNNLEYPKTELIDKKLIKTILIEGIMIGLLSLISFFIGFKLKDGSSSAMCFLTLSFCQIFFSLSLHEGRKRNRMLIISAILGSSLTLASTSIFRIWFKMPHLSPINYLIALALALLFPLAIKLKNKND